MSTSPIEHSPALAQQVTLSGDALIVDLVDGRSITVPIAWYPRLSHATPRERNHWRLIGRGEGIHWPDLDEDISIENLLTGARSGESRRSFKRWLESRQSTV
jgi:uncharacterized protein DUF2442